MSPEPGPLSLSHGLQGGAASSGGTSRAALLLEEPEEPRAPCVWLEWSPVVPVRTEGAEWVCDSLVPPACLWEPEQTRLWEAVNKL